MNRDEVKELMPILQAFLDHKELRRKHGTSWINDHDDIHLDQEYRIKPEPRVFWLIEHQDGSISFFKPGAAPIGASKFIEDLSDEC